jgi:hypothetical protein
VKEDDEEELLYSLLKANQDCIQADISCVGHLSQLSAMLICACKHYGVSGETMMRVMGKLRKEAAKRINFK